MSTHKRLSEMIDEANDRFTTRAKATVLSWLHRVPTARLEWLIMEHYQFSFANCSLLQSAMQCAAALDEQGVSAELKRNLQEEDGHAPMYKQGMLEIGTDVSRRQPFAPTSGFLARLQELSVAGPSCALGAIYATETAAIFEHQLFNAVCGELCGRRGIPYEGSLISHFHFIHLDGGVEQGHKDGLAVFVDIPARPPSRTRTGIDHDEVRAGAFAAIDAMTRWWDALLAEVLSDN